MFARRMFGAAYYAPRYYPQSQGASPVPDILIITSRSAAADAASRSAAGDATSETGGIA